MVEFNEDERAYLVELLEAAHRLLIHEIHHTDASKYQDMLRSKLELNERLTARVVGVSEWVAV